MCTCVEIIQLHVHNAKVDNTCTMMEDFIFSKYILIVGLILNGIA